MKLPNLDGLKKHFGVPVLTGEIGLGFNKSWRNSVYLGFRPLAWAPSSFVSIHLFEILQSLMGIGALLVAITLQLLVVGFWFFCILFMAVCGLLGIVKEPANAHLNPWDR